MPELPEVETTLRGIEPYVDGIVLSDSGLQWFIAVAGYPRHIRALLKVSECCQLAAEPNICCCSLSMASMMIHLGMSGSLRLVDRSGPRRKHDHIEMHMSNGKCLRYHDPRRFGAWLWSESGHPQLDHLGPEPLTDEFSGKRLFELSRKRKIAVKPFIMDNQTVVGVGNIYASEALFRSGIRPDRAAGRISLQRYEVLAGHIKDVLSQRLSRAAQRCGILLMAMASRDISSRL